MRQFSIKYQILLVSMIPVFLIDVFLTTVHINGSIEQAKQLLQSKGEIIAKQIASASEFYLFSGNFGQIKHLLDQSVNSNDIVYSAVYDDQGMLVASAEGHGYSPLNSPQYFYYRQAIRTQDIESSDVFEPEIDTGGTQLRILGWVHLYISKQRLLQNESDIYTEGMLFFLAMLFVAMALTAVISHRITRPVFELMRYLKKIEQGDLGEVIGNVKNNENGEVQKGFNSMSQSLLANRKELNEKINTATKELRHAIRDLEDKNQEIRVARDEAQEANRVKSQFLANISHEIRTPINGIKGFVNLLAQTGLKDNQQRYTDIIRQSTTDLSSIINEVLDFSKLESGKVDINEAEFDLFDLVETTRDSLFTAAMEKGIDLHLTIFSDTPRRVIGDAFRLKQILINLVNNAIKFTERGYVNIKVVLDEINTSETVIHFQVKDSGIGISEQDQQYLFQAFSQIESDSNRRYAGTGLGLVISKNLARLMGGDIELRSTPGVGSTFTLVLPFQSAVMPLDDDNELEEPVTLIYAFDQRSLNELKSLFDRVGCISETQLLESVEELDHYRELLQQNREYLQLIVFDLRHKRFNPCDLFDLDILEQKRIILMHYDSSMVEPDLLEYYEFISVINTCRNIRQLLLRTPSQSPDQLGVTSVPANASRRILIVDDNPINLTLASELTRLWGHQAFEAGHAHQAMALFEQHEFDLILLDIQMPEIDGIELMKMMRSARPDLTTPIVAITANLLESEQQRLLNLGFDAYLGKPLEESKLKALLDADEIQITRVQATIAEPSPVDGEETESVDFDQSLKLSGGNRKLSMDMLRMLQQSIPEYQQQLQQASDKRSLGKLAYTIHKLQGVTCYTGLPKLRQLLANYELVKHADSDKTFEVSSQIGDELSQIDSVLKNHFAQQRT